MKKLLQFCIISLFLCLTAPAAAYAGESRENPAANSVQALAVTDDFIETAGLIKRGDTEESRECRTSFERLNDDSMALIGRAVESAGKHPSYSQDDFYVLAHVICGEAQSCSDEEQLYVGSVVLNRVNSPSFPGTVRDVVFQRGQYSCTRDGNYNREPTDRNWANARYLLETGSVLPGNVVWQSGGRQGKGVYIRTRHHCYCY